MKNWMNNFKYLSLVWSALVTEKLNLQHKMVPCQVLLNLIHGYIWRCRQNLPLKMDLDNLCQLKRLNHIDSILSYLLLSYLSLIVKSKILLHAIFAFYCVICRITNQSILKLNDIFFIPFNNLIFKTIRLNIKIKTHLILWHTF